MQRLKDAYEKVLVALSEIMEGSSGSHSRDRQSQTQLLEARQKFIDTCDQLLGQVALAQVKAASAAAKNPCRLSQGQGGTPLPA